VIYIPSTSYPHPNKNGLNKEKTDLWRCWLVIVICIRFDESRQQYASTLLVPLQGRANRAKIFPLSVERGVLVGAGDNDSLSVGTTGFQTKTAGGTKDSSETSSSAPTTSSTASASASASVLFTETTNQAKEKESYNISPAATTDFETLREAHVGPLMDLNDRINVLTMKETKINATRIVVAGDQSHGKTSLLEALCGINLPRGEGIQTRVPLILQLRRGNEEYAVISI
jgi:hypothetical protein